MSNGVMAPAPAPRKKGLSTLAWVLIGCGGLIVLGIVLFVAGVGFVGSKVKQFAEDAEKNPVATVGKLYAAGNADLEFVSADEAAKSVTFRNTKTGGTETISLEDLEKRMGSVEIDSGGEGGGGPADEPADDSGGT